MGRGCGPWFCTCDWWCVQRVARALTEFLRGVDHIRGGVGVPGQSEGPRGTESAGPFFVSTDVRAAPVLGERRRGVAPLALWFCWFFGLCGLFSGVGLGVVPWGGAVPGDGDRRSYARRTRGAHVVWTIGGRVVESCGYGGVGCSCIVLDGQRPPQPFGPPRTDSAGRPRASPEPTVYLVTGLAVPCRPVTTLGRGPTAHGTIRTPHRPSGATRGFFGPAPGWHGHRDQRSRRTTGHAPYG